MMLVVRALVAWPEDCTVGEKCRNLGLLSGSKLPSKLPLRLYTSLRRSRKGLLSRSGLRHAPAVGVPPRSEWGLRCSWPAGLQGGLGGGRRRRFRHASRLPLSWEVRRGRGRLCTGKVCLVGIVRRTLLRRLCWLRGDISRAFIL